MELLKLEVLQKFLNFQEEDCPVCCGSGHFTMNEFGDKETCQDCYGSGIKEDR